MRIKLAISLLMACFLLASYDASGQIKINLKKKIEKEANKRANEKTEKGVKEGFNKLEKGLEGLLKGDSGEKTDTVSAPGQTGRAQQTAAGNAVSATVPEDKATLLKWSKYDFVPGDKIIFEDNLTGEENGEFPSRWDLANGTVENAEFGGENVIMFRGNATTIMPYLKNPDIDYLPEVFTVEFDLFIPNNSFNVYFYDRKNQEPTRGNTALEISGNRMALGPANSRLPDNESIAQKWAHISIACTNGKIKAYVNDTRLINIPHADFNPTGITLYVYHASSNNPYFVKNIRIAEGGVKYYDRFLQDGKIISNGIRFDTGKASLRPESMGVLNEIYKMLSEHPDVAVSVEGHTDSDGDNDLNQKLSEERAEAVIKQLISMGIPADRLSSKGFGESKPINTNATPEGKAENRRVEFVKTN